MAKNKKLQMGDYDFDGELDLPDFNFDGGPQIADDRKPATKLLRAAAEGYAESHFSPANVRNFIKKALPRGYGEAMDLTDETLGTLRNHINTTAKEVKPVINEIKKTSQRMIPAAEKVLPRKMAEKFKNWTQSVNSAQQDQLNREQMKEAGIQAELGQIFQMQAQAGQERNAELDARERIRDGMDFKRHKDVLGNLNPMRQSLSELSEYQRTIGISYQRKSLELQLRSYYIHAEALEESKRHNQQTTTFLEGILKNTGLPEFAKLKNSERLKEIIRNRFINSVGDSLMDKRRRFVKNLVDRIGKQAQDKVRNVTDQVRTGLGAYESLAELREMQAQFGRQQSGGEQAAELAGGMLSQYHTNKFGGWINKRLEKNEKVARGGNRLMYMINNLPQLALQWANSSRGIGKNDYGATSDWMWGLKDNIKSVLSPESTTMDVDRLEDVRNPDMFNRRTNRSITDVIPGYLARIYRELKIIRTGDENQQLVEYDLTSNKFEDSATVTKNLLNKLAGKSDKDALKRELDSFVDEIDSGKKLSAKQKRALGRLMMNNNLNGGIGDSKLYSDHTSEAYRSMNSEDAAAMADVFKEFFANDSRELKRQVFSRQFSDLGTRISDKRATFQDIVNVNQRHHLEALGLMTPGSNDVNMERLRDYLLEDDADGPASPLGGQRRSSRRRGEPVSNGNRLTQRPIPRITNDQHPGVPPGQQQRVDPAQADPQTREEANVIVRAIEAANPTSAIVDSNRLLAHIIELIESGAVGGGVGGGSGNGGGPRGSWWNRSIGSIAGGAWSRGKGAFDWARRKASSHTNWAFGGLRSLPGKLQSASDWASEKWKKFKDVYVDGEVKPRLLAWKLQAGHYYDQATGQVIKSYRDIRGTVVDAEGNIIMTAQDAQKAFEQSKLGKKMLSAWGFLKKESGKSWDRLQRWVPGIYGTGLRLATDAYKKLGEMLDQPQDVYVAGKVEPVLLAVTMRAGGYASRITSKEIRRPSEIDGPVVDDRGDVVLTAEQLASGLLDKRGNPLKTGYRGLIQRGKNAVTGAYNFLNGKFRQVKNWMFDKVKGISGGIDMHLGLSMGVQTRNQAVLLLQIRDMLNDRLPGDRTEFSEKVNVGGPGGGMKSMFSGVKAKLKSFFGDRDGDGIRDGSYQDLMRRQKEKLKSAKEKAAEKLAAARDKGKGLFGLGKDGWDKLKSLFGKDDDEDDDDGDTNIDIDGANDSDKERKRRRKRRMRRARAGRAGRGARGLWGKTKNLLGRAGGGLARGAGAVGRGLLGGGGMLARGALMAGGGALSLAGSAISGLGGMLLGGVGAIGGGLLSLLASPVVLGGLAVAAVGAAGYYGYKYLTRATLDPYSTMRYAQYGFLAEDDKHLQAIFSLEGQLKDAVVFDGRQARLDEKKINLESLVSTLGVDIKNRDQLENMVAWFDGRFKPVFLNSVAALRAVDPSKSLADVGKLSATQKRQYLNVAKFPEGPYHVTTSPFPNSSELIVGSREVAAAAEMAEAALQKEGTPTTATVATAGAATATAAASAAARNNAGLPGVRLPEKSDLGKINQLAAQAGMAGGNQGAGMLSMSGAVAMDNVFNTGRLDALTALRYRTYGMKEPEAGKVRALGMLEMEAEKNLVIRDGVASWNGSVESMIVAMGSSFGVQGVSNDDAYAWMNWFSSRFLPTYLAYVTALATATKKNNVQQARLTLTPLQAVNVATMIYTAKGVDNGSTVSVWQVTVTPWPGFAVNTDVKTTEGNFQSLKDRAKQSKLNEESANVTTGVTNSSTGSQTTETGKPGFFARLLAERKDSEGKPTGNIFSRMYNNAKDMVSEAVGGREIAHPGKGTGGDINAIPMPKTNGSWEGVKDTIIAAAKMTGVDERLMATMAGIESGFNYNIKAPTSSAKGLYQFTTDTWSDMMKMYGAKYGIAPGTPPTDPRANALLGGEFIKYNANVLKKLGQKLTDTNLYIAHFFGAGGASRFFKANPDAIAATVMPTEAASNGSIFYQNGSPLTIGQVYAKLDNLVRTKGKKFGLQDGSEKIIANAPAAVAAPTAAAQAIAKPVALPVSDQAPMPLVGPAAPVKSTPVATPVAAASAASASPAPENDMGSYTTQRSRNLAAQQQSQRDAAAEMLNTTNQILTRSHDVQTKILENARETLGAIRELAKVIPNGSGAKSGVLDQPVTPVKPARPMTNAPVSMTVRQ